MEEESTTRAGILHKPTALSLRASGFKMRPRKLWRNEKSGCWLKKTKKGFLQGYPPQNSPRTATFSLALALRPLGSETMQEYSPASFLAIFLMWREPLLNTECLSLMGRYSSGRNSKLQKYKDYKAESFKTTIFTPGKLI